MGSARENAGWEAKFKREWVKLHAGLDFPREVEWLEIRKVFGGGIMAIGMD